MGMEKKRDVGGSNRVSLSSYPQVQSRFQIRSRDGVREGWGVGSVSHRCWLFWGSASKNVGEWTPSTSEGSGKSLGSPKATEDVCPATDSGRFGPGHATQGSYPQEGLWEPHLPGGGDRAHRASSSPFGRHRWALSRPHVAVLTHWHWMVPRPKHSTEF